MPRSGIVAEPTSAGFLAATGLGGSSTVRAALNEGDNGAQTGTLYVYGAFKPTTAYWYGCTLMDGSTLDLSGGNMSAASSSTKGPTALSFEESATVNITVGDRKVSALTPIMSWTEETKPANIDTVTFVRADADRKYSIVRKSDGLYLETGLIIIFR